MNIIPILEKLISFRSITPSGKEALEYVAQIIEPYGFICDIQSFGQGDEETFNLYAYLGTSKPNICFAGHVDVVPPGDASSWVNDPFQLNIDDSTVTGRGVVDMKGAVAAFIAALEEYLSKNQPKGSISIMLTTDEEGTGKNGLVKMLEHIKGKYEPVDFCIVGEPTSEHAVGDIVKIGRRGSISFHLVINGKQGHVAYPQKAVNPVSIMNKILYDLQDLILDEGSEFFDPSNLEITSIDTGNDVGNVIPAVCQARFNIRFNDSHDEKALQYLVTKIVSKHSDNYDISHSCSSLPFIQDYSSKMQQFVSVVKEVTGQDTIVSTSGGTSDARHIHKYAEVVEFGLNSDQAHKINEHCKISDLQTLYKVYYAYLVEVFKN